MKVRIFEFFENAHLAQDEINVWLDVENLRPENIICIKQSEIVDNSSGMMHVWNLTISIWYHREKENKEMIAAKEMIAIMLSNGVSLDDIKSFLG